MMARMRDITSPRNEIMKHKKAQHPCRVCGKLAHWYKENTECRDRMMAKIRILEDYFKKTTGTTRARNYQP